MIRVAAAIIRRDNKILICRRGAGGSCAFLWEFPGGKLEPGETLAHCLVRECKEELGVDIKVGEIFAKTTYAYPEQEIAFTFFHAEIISGEAKPAVHEEILWVAPEKLSQYAFCPADVEIVERLML